MQPLVPTLRRDRLEAGASQQQLALELRSGRVVVPFRGVHVTRGHDVGFLAQVRAALTTQEPPSAATFTTAAAVQRLRWIPHEWYDVRRDAHIAVPAHTARRHRAGLRLHRRDIRPGDVTEVGGVACFSVTRTLIELARDPAVPRLLVVQIIDGALRDRRATKVDLEQCLARFRGERGIARARELVRLSRGGVDSPAETRMRLMLLDGGIVDIEVGLEINDDDGLLLARGDLGLKRYLIWGEYDGFDSHSGQRVFRSDRVGDRWLRRRGWHVMRFVDEDFTRPAAVVREWKAAIADAPARIAALPATRSPDVAEARRLLGLN